MKPFALSGLSPHAHVLDKNEFRFFYGEEEHIFDKEKMKAVVKEAEKHNCKDIGVLKISDYKKYETEGSTTAYGTPYYDRLVSLCYLGFAEAYEKKGRFLSKLCDFLWAMLEESSWMLPEHSHVRPIGEKLNTPPASLGGKYEHGLEIASLYRAASMTVLYYLNKEEIDGVSPIIGERLNYAMRERVILPYLHTTLHWSGEFGKRPNNWGPWCVESVLTIASLTVDSIHERRRIVERAMLQLDNFMDGYGVDGGCDEGPTYWGVATGCLFDALELLYDMTGGYLNVFDTPLLKSMAEYIARFNISGKYFVNFADSKPTVSPDGEMVKRIGEKCNSDILISFGDYLCQEKSESLNPKRAYRSLCSLTKSSVGSEIERIAATDTYYRDIQVMLLRESNNPEKGKFFAIKAGHNGESHNHNDTGSFIIYQNAKPVLIDAGVGGYTKDTFGPGRYKIWSMQSLYHNLASFDGIGQHQGKLFKSSDVAYDEKKRSLSMQLASAYPEEAGVVDYQRCGSLLGDTVTLTDKISLDKEREIDFIFLTHKEPKALCDGELLLAEDCVMRYDTSLKLRLEEFDPVGINTMETLGVNTLWRIHLTKTTDKCELSFTIS